MISPQPPGRMTAVSKGINKLYQSGIGVRMRRDGWSMAYDSEPRGTAFKVCGRGLFDRDPASSRETVLTIL
jgi:hypothetical protein